MWPSPQTGSFDSAGIFGVGVGYQFNNWFSADVTGEYRGKSNFTGLDVDHRHWSVAGFVGTDDYAATKSEFSFSPTPMSISAPGGA